MESNDLDAIRAFLAAESPSSNVPDSALLGKLVGNLVAVLAMEITAETIVIRDLVVTHDLRRKRIGRVMLNELVALAAKIDRDWLVFGCSAPRGFLERMGFDDEGKRMVRSAG